MTDHTKRASTGGRTPVATPRVSQHAGGAGGASSTPTEATLQKALGAKAQVKYRPIPNTEHSTTGYIDSVSTDLKQVILRSAPNAGELRLIALDRILEVTILDAATPSTMPLPVIPLTPKEITGRLESELAKERTAREHMNTSVDKSVQDLYDSIRRMLPDCKWSGKSFVVNESAVVEPPYGAENVRAMDGVRGAEKNVIYVKKVVENERKRLADRAGTPSQSLAPGQRKGG